MRLQCSRCKAFIRHTTRHGVLGEEPLDATCCGIFHVKPQACLPSPCYCILIYKACAGLRCHFLAGHAAYKGSMPHAAWFENFGLLTWLEGNACKYGCVPPSGDEECFLTLEALKGVTHAVAPADGY